MAELNFSALNDDANDDLPRAFRREKEARAKEAMERAARERAAAGPTLSMGSETPQNIRPDVAPRTTVPVPQIGPSADIRPAEALSNDVGMPATVKRFDVPFGHLVRFFLKCAVAAIPAMIVLGISLWLLGAISTVLFPDLVKLKILVGFGS